VKISTRNPPGVKAAGAWGWRPHHLHGRMSWKSWSLNLLEPSGSHRVCYGNALPFFTTTTTTTTTTRGVLISP
jgi:hypothetical protein